jgi:ribosome-binding factor A
MSRRTQRIESLIRSTLGQLLLTKLSDPRIEPALTSITRVEVPEDLLTAKVFVSVLGTEAQQRTTLRALSGASGHIQELMMREIELRNTPILTFELDVSFKKTIETYKLIQEAMNEIRRKEEQQGQDVEPHEPPAEDAPKE